MLIIEDLSDIEKKIIKKICFLQLSSLRRIYNDNPKSNDDIVMLLLDHDVSKDDFQNQLERNIEQFEKIGQLPEEFIKLSKKDMSMFKHILTNIEEIYKDKYPKAISNLWRRVFILEELKENINLN